MDVISLTAKKLNLTTHEALNYLKDLLKKERSIGKKKSQSQVIIEKRPESTVFGLHYGKDFEQMTSSYLSSQVAQESTPKKGTLMM